MEVATENKINKCMPHIVCGNKLESDFTFDEEDLTDYYETRLFDCKATLRYPELP
jgi:hypothetical protein